MSIKRQSLRQKRNRSPREHKSNASDSSIASHLHGEASSAQNNGGLGAYPESPDDVSNWEQRRRDASRQPPRPMQSAPPSYSAPQNIDMGGIYEMDAGPITPLSADDEALARHLDARQQRDDFPIPVITRSNEDYGFPQVARPYGQNRNATNTGLGIEQGDKALARGIELSLRYMDTNEASAPRLSGQNGEQRARGGGPGEPNTGTFGPPRREDSGFDANEVAEAMARSLHVK